MKGSTRAFEVVALLVVVLIPVGFILYAMFGTSNATPTPAAAQQPAQPAPASPQYLSSASISLDNESALPTSVAAGQFAPFSFTITNTGTAGGEIPFKVTVKWSTGEQDVIDENIATLAAGASQTVQENLKFEVATETARVSLQLPTIDQNVQFTLPKPN